MTYTVDNFSSENKKGHISLQRGGHVSAYLLHTQGTAKIDAKNRRDAARKARKMYPSPVPGAVIGVFDGKRWWYDF